MKDPGRGQAGSPGDEAVSGGTGHGAGAGGAGADDDRLEGENGPGWREAGEELDDLRETFRSSYQEGAGEGPSREDVIGALRTLGEAITHIAAGAGNTLKDPQVKQQVKKTTSSAVSAISGILLEWSADLRRRMGERQDRDGEVAEDRGDAGPPSSPAGADTGPADSDAGKAPPGAGPTGD